MTGQAAEVPNKRKRGGEETCIKSIKNLWKKSVPINVLKQLVLKTKVLHYFCDEEGRQFDFDSHLWSFETNTLTSPLNRAKVSKQALPSRRDHILASGRQTARN